MKGKLFKQIQLLYDYSQALDQMPPRGDGAKDAVALEIHQACVKVFNILEKQIQNKPGEVVKSAFLFLELVERMLLDKIGDNYTPEEMIERSDS